MLAVHNHSEFSALDGFGTAAEIAVRVESLGMPGAFLTDHGTVSGLLPFHKAMAAKGLFAGFGIEAYQAPVSRKLNVPRKKKEPKNDSFHLVLLAQTYEGYMNLLRLSDEANRTGFYYNPRVDWELLEKYSEGVIATSACLSGLVPKGVQKDDLEAFHNYQRIFRDRFYIEIHTYQAPKQVEVNLALAELLDGPWDVQPIVANDAHYPAPEQWESHELMVAINEGRKFDMEHPKHPQCLYIMSEEQIREKLDYLPERIVDAAIANTDVLHEKCQFSLPETRSHLPKFKSTADKSNGALLIEKVAAFVADLPQEYHERALIELEALTDAGLEDYFLIVEEFCNWAAKHNIMVGPGRGSAGGSLVAYALGITAVDPLKYGLFFERFWNPGRAKGLPDIDIDFEQSRRPEVKEHLARIYGQDRVLGIGNHIRFRPKSAIERAAMAMKIPYQDSLTINKIIDKTTDAGHLADWEEIIELVGEELDPWVKKYGDLFHYAEMLTDRISTYGVHASAVVVSDVDLPGQLPLMRRTDQGKNVVFVTAHDMYSVEAQGFPKFDLLGLKTLDVLKRTVELAGVPDFDFRAHNYAIEPESFWRQLDIGRTLGLFQIESGHAARRIGKQMKPRSILDLAAIVALNRPGPLRSKATDRYLEVRAGDSEAAIAHPVLGSILDETYGEIIYQEQVIQLCWALGYSLSDADHVRKILGKKQVEEMKAEEPRFMDAASAVMGEVKASKLWFQIAEFSKYSFNKSHAVAYGLICAWTMYAKWRWPQEFIMASIMTRPALRGAFITEARRMGIAVNPPDVNRSNVTIDRCEGEIYFGLSEIKYVGKDAAQWVVDHRPPSGYKNPGDLEFIRAEAKVKWQDADKLTRGKSPSQICNARAIDMMVKAGAFDKVTPRDIEMDERIDFEEDLLGLLMTDIYAPVIEKNRALLSKCVTVEEAEEAGAGKVAGIVTAVRTTMTKKNAWKNPNEEMAHVTIEWEGEELRMAAFPEEWRGNQHSLALRNVGVFTVEMNGRGARMLNAKRLYA